MSASAAPPPFVDLLWCPVCGRDNRVTELRKGAGRHYSTSKKCPGAPQRVRYKRDDSTVIES